MVKISWIVYSNKIVICCFMTGELWFMAVFSNFYKSSFCNPATFIEIAVFTIANSDLEGSGRMLPDLVIKGVSPPPPPPPQKKGSLGSAGLILWQK